MSNTPHVKGADREALLLTAQGLIAETYPRSTFTSGNIAVTGTVYYMAVPLLANDLVTSLVANVGVAAVGMTLSKAGLYDSTGTRLALSLDQGVAFQSLGHKIIPMIAAFRILTSGLYYVALLSVFTVTGPSFARGGLNSGGTVNSPINAGARPFGVQLAQADLPATAIIVDGAANSAFHYYIAVI